jgi:hypothetical protein
MTRCIWTGEPDPAAFSTNVRSITVLTVPDSVFTRGAPASTSDNLRRGTQQHLEIDFKRVLDVKDHIGLDDFLESGFFDFDVIRARREVRETVAAADAGCRLVTGIRRVVDDHDFRVGNGCLRGIGDAARESGVSGLLANSGSKRRN